MKVTLAHANEHYKAKYNLDDAFFEEYKRLRTISDAEKTEPFNGAIELCAAICASGGKNYLYTHRNDSAITAMEKCGIAQYFTEFITSRQNLAPKPDPDAVLHLLEKHKIPHDEAIMIGDRDIDILSGKNAGIYSCYFSDGGDTCDCADYNANNFLDFYPILGLNT
jgi:HAD superfamily hydrolase (TIGR01549 family)